MFRELPPGVPGPLSKNRHRQPAGPLIPIRLDSGNAPPLRRPEPVQAGEPKRVTTFRVICSIWGSRPASP